MTKRERFANFLAGKPVDRVPVAFFHHFCGPDEWGRGLENAEAFERNVMGHKRALEKFCPDVAKIMNDTLMIMPLDVSFVKKAADLRSVRGPAVNSAFAKKTLELTKRVMDIYEGVGAPVYATGFSPSFVLRSSLCVGGIPGEGDESRLRTLMSQDPDAVAAAMENLCEDISAINEMLIREGGVDGIYFSVSNQNGFFTGEFYRSYVAPAEKRVMVNANRLGGANLLHICGYHGRSNDLRLFTDFEAAAYNIAVHAEGVSLSEGKKLFGGRPVFGGYAQDTVIYRGSRQEIKETAWRILDECGQTGVMLGADCTVPNDIDDARLEWVRQAAIEYAETH